METIIRAKDLFRQFDSREGTNIAVDHISLHIESEKIFGLLGPNGAGKSTIIKMLTTILLPTSGSLEVLGYDVYNEEKKIRPQIGLLYGGEHGLYWQLSGRDNLRFFGSLFHIEKKILEQRIDYWLNRVGLTKDQDRSVGRYSKGMKQRLHIARSMLHDPKILFLDEPTLGLDPQGTLDLRTIIMEAKEQGKTIILTTHDMEEAQELCDEVAFIMDGKIVRQGTLEDLQKSFQESNVYEVEVIRSPNHLLPLLKARPEFKEYKELKNGHTVLTFELLKSISAEDRFSEVVNLLSSCTISQMLRKKIDLRNMYLQLVNQPESKQESVTSS